MGSPRQSDPIGSRFKGPVRVAPPRPQTTRPWHEGADMRILDGLQRQPSSRRSPRPEFTPA
jgi:hypothetical protein